ncbi:UDP-N-acetylmuramate--L-alanine ligase [Phycicoccus sp. Soil748]|uniref:UDP-N-acetylmuramate--L-alanine ligase n=1 Tax=Phycicoccus sp. Soil748 TaxID=1736397 RepID=UPI00070386A2|nr:UDP-N-acetylmuramate--L-alanine ligase [Phycicoccus sp. Soil748]KRE55732.1 UDP-N-acetylmuramate--alanine ligase [Phycicoccus sp. Soil748]
MNGENQRFTFTDPVPPLGELGAVHFIAIGGAGMSGVARVMLARGCRVSGSDAKESPVLAALAAEGATVHVGHDVSHLDGVDTVVISSAIRESNVELAEARRRGLRVLHRSQALASTMAGSRRVAVAGANGKTTTTSMLTVALQHCGVDPSFAAGGELAKHGTNAHWGTGDVFVAEADESDGSFLVYRPDVAVVTNVQADHLDFYGTFANVQQAYAQFVASVKPGGLLVACHDDAGSLELATAARAAGTRVLTYGWSPEADVVLRDEVSRGLMSRVTVAGPDGEDRALRINIPGRHNLLNAAAAYTVAVEGLEQEPTRVLDGLFGFTGTRRRFEPKGTAAGVTVVDDYAHNPGKVSAVVSTAAELVGEQGRLLVVFQPHLYSRTRDFAAEFARALAPADVVLLMEVYGAREDPVPGVSSELVADALREVRANADVTVVPSWSAVAGEVASRARAGDLVLTVGAGDVTMVGPEILRALGES